MNKTGDQSEEQKINKMIPLKAESFARSQGIFVDTYKGNLTTIVKRFNNKAKEDDPSNDSKLISSQNDILQLLVERDEQGRTPLDLACFLGFKNIALYLITKMGNPQVVIKQEINVDNVQRNAYHKQWSSSHAVRSTF